MEFLIAKMSSAFSMIVYNPILNLWKNTLFTKTFLLVLAFSLLIEALFPARPMKKWWRVGFAQDIVWFFYETMLHAAVLATYVFWISSLYHNHFEFLTLETVKELPFWSRFLIGLFLTDFLYWLQHRINHAVPWFWQFHAVHHSQREMNFFTDFRYHIFEYFVRETILAIPFLLLGMSAPTIAYFSIFQKWYTRFYHANIKSDLGWLRYILVTPQSHRIHHSIETRHYDKNFGSIFSIWDFLFRVQYKGFNEYPETGINDREFPMEKNRNFLGLLATPLIQLIYPFRVIGKQIYLKFSAHN